MKREKRMIISVAWIVIGAILVYLAIAEKVDEFWSGMGSTLLLIGILQLLRFYRFNKNETYREKIEIAEKDERNKFLRNKAWAWSGYLFVLIAAVGCIVFKIMEQDLLSMAASGAVCLMIVLHWISYAILKRKY